MQSPQYWCWRFGIFRGWYHYGWCFESGWWGGAFRIYTKILGCTPSRFKITKYRKLDRVQKHHLWGNNFYPPFFSFFILIFYFLFIFSLIFNFFCLLFFYLFFIPGNFLTLRDPPYDEKFENISECHTNFCHTNWCHLRWIWTILDHFGKI